MNYKEYAESQGWFKQLETENVSLAIGKNVKGLLDILRGVFPDNYVGKEKIGKQWVYTVYKGDKELMEMLHKPLRFENPKTTMKNYLKELK